MNRPKCAHKNPSSSKSSALGRAIEPLESRVLLATVPQGFTDATIVSSLNSPTSMAVAPDGRLFFTQQNGQVRVVKNGQLLSTPFATVNANSHAERGLLGITFDPNFAQNSYVYVYYTANSPTVHNRVSRFTASGDVASGGETAIIDLPNIGDAIWHMGGAIHFGPDGKLYVAVGDHQQGGTSQSLTSTFGKMLRINSDGSIPTDNPFYDQTTGINRAIWARGLRNPFTFGFQPGTGRMFINDVGQETWEEINNGLAGANYGWPNSEGPNNTGGFNAPFYYYSHAEGCSIAGAAFYNPPTGQFPSQYVGKYFFGDYCGGWIRTIDPNNGSSVGNFASGINGMVDVDVAPDGTMYYLARGFDLTSGSIGRITYAQGSVPVISQHPQDASASLGEPVTFNVIASGTGPLSYLWQRRSAGAGSFSNIPGATSSSYTIGSVASGDHDARFRVVVSNGAGQTTSNDALLTVTNNQAPVATITAPTSGSTFRAGDTIDYSGTGVDPEDGTLPGSAFTWQVDYYTNGLARPFLPATSGSTGGSFVVPTTGIYKRPDVFFRFILTVEDSGGRTHTVTRDIHPETSTITLQTNVPGLQLALDGQPMPAPLSFGSVVNFQREIGAPTPQTIDGTSYEFIGWSDGGAITHTISTPEDDTTYTATFAPVSVVYLSDLAWISATNGWGPVERDRSNGEQGANDGGPITLEGLQYAKGLGVHAQSDVRFDLGGNYTRFLVDVGVDDEVGSQGTVGFRIFKDFVLAYDSGKRYGHSPTLTVDLDVTGVQNLRLLVIDYGDGNAADHADWANARLVARPLAVTGSSFRWQTAPHALSFTFDANVSASLTLADFVIRNTTTGVDIPSEAMALAYDDATNTATITFPGLSGAIVADGTYRATILAGGVVSSAGNALVSDHVYNFFHLTGDANHDGAVNLQDFNILASNFGGSMLDFSEGDFNYDGVVNLADFNRLASKFGVTLDLSDDEQ